MCGVKPEPRLSNKSEDDQPLFGEHPPEIEPSSLRALSTKNPLTEHISNTPVKIDL